MDVEGALPDAHQLSFDGIARRVDRSFALSGPDLGLHQLFDVGFAVGCEAESPR